LILAGCGTASGGTASGPVAARRNAADDAAVAVAPAVVRAVDPCTLLTDPEVRTLVGEIPAHRVSGGGTHSTCTVTTTSGKQVVRVAVFGNADTAPAVFTDRLRFGEEPQRVVGVGRAAFSVFRPDEAGIVTLTQKAVLAVSILATDGTLRDPQGTLERLMPVVRQAAARM
jgi:hypothetical protein